MSKNFENNVSKKGQDKFSSDIKQCATSLQSDCDLNTCDVKPQCSFRYDSFDIMPQCCCCKHYSLDKLPIKYVNLTPREDKTSFYPKLIIRNDYNHDDKRNTGYIPSYPEYNNFEKRLETYKIWPHNKYQRGIDMAEAGFFYSGREDICICKQCNVELHGWNTFEYAMKEHKYNSPLCKFVQDNYNFRRHEWKGYY